MHSRASQAALLTCSLVAALAGCDKNDGDGGDGLALGGRTFYAQSATDDGEPHAFVEGTTVSVSFDDGRVGASAGCNSFDGDYVIENEALMVTNAGWTEIGCEPDLAAQETWYFEFLLSSPALALAGDDLTLTGDTTEIVYLDKEVATPDKELVGPLWTVDTIIEGDTASAAEWSELATLQFNPNGEVDVTTGCNVGGGGYTVDGDTITFDEVGVTEEGCADEIHQLLEEAVLEVLHHDAPATFEIDANRLWLEIPGAGLRLSTD